MSKAVISQNQKVENFNELEIVGYPMTIDLAGQTKTIDNVTESRYKRLVGLFVMQNNGDTSDVKSKLSYKLNKEIIVEDLPACLYEKTKYQSIRDCALQVVRPVQNSAFTLNYTDGSTAGQTYPYSVIVFAIYETV